MIESAEWLDGIEGDFPVHKTVSNALPAGATIVSAKACGISAWTKTAMITTRFDDDRLKRYFLKCATGQGAHPLVEGEYHSANAINAVVSDLVPKAVGWGEYFNDESVKYYFYLGDYHDMDFSRPPHPQDFMSQIAELHQNSQSPTGMFGFDVPTACGKMERTVKWESSWAQCFINQLQDVIRYDNETNGVWPEFDAACQQLTDVVIPRLLGALQSDGRNIKPCLIHGDLWERNIGIDVETCQTVLFDPGSTYAHNEMEFGTWRCTWSYYFNSPSWMRQYSRHIDASEPQAEWDDRNRLYSLHPYLNDSAGHAGSASRQIAYNDMLYLCEKYGPSDSLEKYDPEKDVSITGAYVPFVMKQLE